MSGKNAKDEKKTDAIALYRNEAFDIGFHDYFKNIKSNKVSQVLNNRERNVKFDTITYRQLNSWEKEGLLTTDREGREWRRFSIMDALWLRIVKELREFGMGWQQVKTAKKSLEFESKRCGVAMPLLEFYTAFAIGSKMPVLLLIFKDGATVPANFTQYKVAREFLGMENHLQINLNEILQSFFPSVDLKAKYKGELPMDMDEMELLAFLRLGEFEKVEILFKSGKMQTVEGMQRLDATKTVADVIKEHAYQKIEVVIEGGQKVALRRVVKKQINKKG